MSWPIASTTKPTGKPVLPSGTHICVQWPSLGFYHRARLRRLGEDLRDIGGRLTALQTSSSERAYPWHDDSARKVQSSDRDPYEVQTLFPGTDFETLPPNRIHTAIRRRLSSIDPDVIATNSYSLPDARAALAWGRRHRRAVMLMNDSKRDDAPRSSWREFIKTRLLRGFDAALVAGTPQVAYHRALGLPEEAIWTGYDVVDNGYFATSNSNDRSPEAFESTAGDLHPNAVRPYLVAVGRMKELKNFDGLIEAYARYRRHTRDPFSLVLIGDGPVRERIESLARERCEGDVHFTGFQPPDRLRRWYRNAEALVHPAKKDTWGLVVNEAMAAGLPVLISTAAGCTEDLVQPESNGLLFEPSDIEQLTDVLRRFHRLSTEERKQMGKRSQAIVADWDLDRFSKGFRAAASYALDHSDRGISGELRLLLFTIRMLARSTDSFHSTEV